MTICMKRNQSSQHNLHVVFEFVFEASKSVYMPTRMFELQTFNVMNLLLNAWAETFSHQENLQQLPHHFLQFLEGR